MKQNKFSVIKPNENTTAKAVEDSMVTDERPFSFYIDKRLHSELMRDKSEGISAKKTIHDALTAHYKKLGRLK